MAEAGLNSVKPVPSAAPFLAAERRLQIVTVIVLAAVWEGVSASGLLYRGVVPSVLAIAASLAVMPGEPSFWFNLSTTLTEIVLAILAGGSLGLATGIALGGSRFLGAAFGPYVICLGSAPKVILLPVIILLVGIGLKSKVVVGAIACFMPMAISTAAGVRQINPVLIRVGRSFRLSRGQMFGKVLLPAMLTPLANGLRLALGPAIVVCLVAEIKFSNAGVGHMVIDSFNRSRFAEVYAWLIVITAVALVGNALIGRLARRYGGAAAGQ